MTAKTLKHKFVSAIADGTDTTLVRPSNWNADHDFYLGINAQTGNSYTVADGDSWTLVTYNNAAPVAVTLSQAGASSQFLSGWVSFHRNLGVGEVIITPTTSTINGASTLVLAQGQDAIVVSDGANYQAVVTHGASAETSVASAATCDIGNPGTARVAITGTTTITSLGTKPDRIRYVRFTGALTLTHNASSLILPGAANITTAAGDTAVFVSDSSGNWRCLDYVRADGQPLIVNAVNVASAATADLGSTTAQCITITGTTTITSFGSTAPLGVVKFVEFSAALTLTHNAISLILPTGANIVTIAGDVAVFRHEGSGNWRCLHFFSPGAWAAYTPTITASSGTFTATSGSGAWKQIGKTVFFRVDVTITTVGTASGTLTISPPVVAVTPKQYALGREIALTGKAVTGQIGDGNLAALYYDNTSIITSGAVVKVSGCYEAF